MKTIALAGGSEVTVDDQDFEYLSTRFTWWLHKDESHPIGYAQGTMRGSRAISRKKVYMHRIVAEMAGLDINGRLVDHISMATLDNRRSNLRTATHSQSQHNKGISRNNRSGFKGVCWWAERSIWIVQLNKGGRKFARCYFQNLLDAAQASMLLRFLAHGEFANLN